MLRAGRLSQWALPFNLNTKYQAMQLLLQPAIQWALPYNLNTKYHVVTFATCNSSWIAHPKPVTDYKNIEEFKSCKKPTHEIMILPKLLSPAKWHQQLLVMRVGKDSHSESIFCQFWQRWTKKKKFMLNPETETREYFSNLDKSWSTAASTSSRRGCCYGAGFYKKFHLRPN